MITLNLKAESPELQAIKEFLQENANEFLAEKINNGVYIQKDGKRLLNKKDLASFMKSACEEARKLSAKGATSACVKDEIVFGWAMHYFEENSRVCRQVSALEKGDFPGFLELVKESGRSSFMYLQNVTVSGRTAHQEVALTLAVCEKLLGGRGACRVHGGGFAGTVQAFVPADLVEQFHRGMEELLGQGSCLWMDIRPYGGVELEVQP